LSAQEFESVLARLYTDPDFRSRFLEAPEAALADQPLSENEKADLAAIDRAGLVMASQSYYRKRMGRRKPAGWRAFFSRLFT
jgi:hypothetical protein